jgi:alpha-1,2-mannosyltransferase
MDAISQSDDAVTRWTRWFLAGLLLFFIGLSVQYTIKITCSERDNRSAFLRWRDQIMDLNAGIDIYSEHNYPNPPIMAILMQPLAYLPPLVGSLLWFYLKVAMAFLVFHWVFRLVESPERPFPVWARVAAMLLSLRPIVGDLTHGNINIFILFLVVGSLYAFRYRRDVVAGLLLGLAIACKVTPALFLPYFVWKRAWGVVAGSVAGMVLFLWLVPGLFLGHNHNMFLFQQWMDQMIVPYVVEGEVTTEHQNQSLPGLVYRFTTEGPSFSVYNFETEEYDPVEYHNVVNLDPEIPRAFLKLCMVAFAAVIVWTCRTPTRDRRNWRLAVEYSLIVLGMLLFSERTWKHHCVTLMLPFTLLVYCLATLRLNRGLHRGLIATLVMVVVLISCTSSGLFGTDADGLAKMAQVFGAYVWANLLLTVALVVLLRQVPAFTPSFQPPHSSLLRVGGESPTLTPPGSTDAKRSPSDGQPTESLCDARDPRGRLEANQGRLRR